MVRLNVIFKGFTQVEIKKDYYHINKLDVKKALIKTLQKYIAEDDLGDDELSIIDFYETIQ